MLLSFAKGLLSPETLCFHSQNIFFFFVKFLQTNSKFLGGKKNFGMRSRTWKRFRCLFVS